MATCSFAVQRFLGLAICLSFFNVKLRVHKACVDSQFPLLPNPKMDSLINRWGNNIIELLCRKYIDEVIGSKFCTCLIITARRQRKLRIIPGEKNEP